MENFIWRIMEKYIVLVCMLQCCYGVIYKLNDSEYKRMPPKYETDSFANCRSDPNGVFCFAEFELVSDTPSPLLDMIHEYSEHNTTHFNHTKIFKGICVTETCTKFNQTGLAIETVLEACLNESLYKKHQLKTRLTDRWSCNKPEKDMQPDDLDIAVAAICGVILLMNLIGTLYEPIFGEGTDAVTKFLLCFSIRKNWRKLTAPIAENQDPRLKRLKSIIGIRTISIIFVIMGHAIIASTVFIENSEFAEQIYHMHSMKVLLPGTLIMQTFLIISGFLLIYNALLQAEMHNMSWAMIPKLIGLRWLRLTPTYAVVLALHVTWFKFLSDGPLWQELVGNEVEDCRENWWMNLMYINNYNDKSLCMQHTWYVATDTQLYFFGVVMFLLLKSPRSRKIFLPIIIVVGAIIPGLVTYYMNLDGCLIPSPEAIHTIFMNEPTFNYTFRRGHTNLAAYSMGLSLAYIVYHYQKKGIDVNRLRKYRYLVSLLIPSGLALLYSCSWFFGDRPRPELWIRTISACLIKPTFSFLLTLMLFSCIFKIDDLCRRILEWRGWTVPSRLTYCAYLLHVAYIRTYLSFQTTIFRTNLALMYRVFVEIALVSFIAAMPLWLMVEAPAGNLIREYITKPKKFNEKADNIEQKGNNKKTN